MPVCYIGSADLMPRNLDRRIEALVPIDDPALRRQVEDVLAVNLEDDSLAWRLDADGDWWPVAGAPRPPHGHAPAHARAVDDALHPVR